MSGQTPLILTEESYFKDFLQQQIKAGEELEIEISKLKSAYDRDSKKDCDDRFDVWEKQNTFFLKNALDTEENVYLQDYLHRPNRNNVYKIREKVARPEMVVQKKKNKPDDSPEVIRRTLDKFCYKVNRRTGVLFELLSHSSGFIFSSPDNLSLKNTIKYLIWRKDVKELLRTLTNLADAKESKDNTVLLFSNLKKLTARNNVFKEDQKRDDPSLSEDEFIAEENAIIKGVWLALKEASQVGLFEESNIKRYPAFISYSRANLQFVTKLRQRLKLFGVKTWLDSDQVLGGDNIPAKVYQAIRITDKAILVGSKNYITSDWAREELYEIFRKQREHRSHGGPGHGVIIPISLEPILKNYNIFQDLQKKYPDTAPLQDLKIIDFSSPDDGKFQVALKELLTVLRMDRN